MTLYVATRNFLASRVPSFHFVAEKSVERVGHIQQNEILACIGESSLGTTKVVDTMGKIYYVSNYSIEKWMIRIDLHEDIRNQKSNLCSKSTFF